MLQHLLQPCRQIPEEESLQWVPSWALVFIWESWKWPLTEKSPWIPANLLYRTLSEGFYGQSTSLAVLLHCTKCSSSYYHVLQCLVEACLAILWLWLLSRGMLFREKWDRLCPTKYGLIHLMVGRQVLHHCAALFFLIYIFPYIFLYNKYLIASNGFKICSELQARNPLAIVLHYLKAFRLLHQIPFPLAKYIISSKIQLFYLVIKVVCTTS